MVKEKITMVKSGKTPRWRCHSTMVPSKLHRGAVKTPPWWSGNATVVKFLQHHGEISTFTVVKKFLHLGEVLTFAAEVLHRACAKPTGWKEKGKRKLRIFCLNGLTTSTQTAESNLFQRSQTKSCSIACDGATLCFF